MKYGEQRSLFRLATTSHAGADPGFSVGGGGGVGGIVLGKAISRVLKDNCKLPHAFETSAFLAVLIMDYS